MGIEEFSEENNHLDQADGDVRPRVSEQTHENIKKFAEKAGIDISEGYDYLIGACLSDQQILEQILTSGREYSDNLTSLEEKLLEDIAEKCKEQGCFPDRKDINKDPSMRGFPMYIIHLGSTQRIRELVDEKYPDAIPE